MRMALATVATFCALLLPTAALADAVPGPPDNCPPGSKGVTSHRGPDCVFADCTGGEACPDGSECRPIARCFETREVDHWRRPDTKVKRDFDVGFCDDAGKCPDPAKCRKSSQCEPSKPHPHFDPKTRKYSANPIAVPPETKDEPPHPDPKDPPAKDDTKPPAKPGPDKPAAPESAKTGCSTSGSRPPVFLMLLLAAAFVTRGGRGRAAVRGPSR